MIFSSCQVTKVLFSYNGSKFASVDNDGILCLWQATQGSPVKKPFFVCFLIPINTCTPNIILNNFYFRIKNVILNLQQMFDFWVPLHLSWLLRV